MVPWMNKEVLSGLADQWNQWEVSLVTNPSRVQPGQQEKRLEQMDRGEQVLKMKDLARLTCFVTGAEFSSAPCSGRVEVPEGVGPLVPAELPTDAVGHRGDKLSSQTQLGAQRQGKGLGGVLPLRHVPLKLVHQRDVPHMDVELWNMTHHHQHTAASRPHISTRDWSGRTDGRMDGCCCWR